MGAGTTRANDASTTPPVPVKLDPSGLRTLAQELAALREAEGVGETEPVDVDPADRWALCRREAAAIEPGHIGTLLWIDARCQAARMHALDSWWVDEMRRFYRSELLTYAARVGLRGGKSATICRSLVNDALFGLVGLDPSTPGVIPIMSADRTEATDRFDTIIAILRACGVASTKKGEEGLESPGGLMSTYTSSTLPSGGGVIKLLDSQGHDVQFRIYPARLAGVIGHTDKGGFGDEVDTWPVDLGVSSEDVAQRSAKGKANPADVVLDRWNERFTTTIAAAVPGSGHCPRLYLVSASYYGQDTAHARKIGEGDTEIQMVARLGVLGAARDTAGRRWLAAKIGSTDPRLLAEADPMSTDVPAWVTSPAAPIDVCYRLSRGRIGPMLGRYGGRPDESEGRTAGPLAALVFSPPSHHAPCLDTVTGIAPDAAGWVTVTVGIDAAGTLRVVSVGAGLGGLTGSALVANAQHEARLRSEIAALVAGAPVYVPGVEARALYDGATLRTGALRTLYERGRVRHAPGLGALEAALHAYVEEEPAPHVEALVAATLRLVACYPWLGVEQGEAAKGPAPRRGLFEDGGGGRVSMAGPRGTVRRG